MSFHTFGDSHALHPWNQIPGVVVHHLGAVLCYSVGQEKLNRLNIKNDVAAGDTACFCFGEIDCRCHVHKHLEGTTFPAIIDRIVQDYFSAIELNAHLVPGVRIAVYNVVPPCSRLNSPEDPGYPYQGSDEERKSYARYFNWALAGKCKELGYTFIDVYSRYVSDSGFLDKAFSDGHVHITNPVFLEEFLHARSLL